jgi:cobyrinic acid a,c-diamide synthase
MTSGGPARGFVIAAPSSGSGKTVTTLSLLALLKAKGIRVSSGKVGPDYIDPAFHQAATGRTCFNLDSWAMRPATLRSLLAEAARNAELVVIEGVMGLFDGVPHAEHDGSTAELARLLDLPVILVMNAKGQGATAAAVLKGLAGFDPRIRIAGVIFNKAGSAAHREILTEAVAPLGIPVLGFVPRDDGLDLPERHLGLKQAGEMPNLQAFLSQAAETIGPHLGIDRLLAAAGPIRTAAEPLGSTIPPLGQRIAVAEDIAFAFSYSFQLEAWRRAGAEVRPFSPLADETPKPDADAVFLPGGYPELHAGKLAGNRRFMDGLKAAAARGAAVYGECGGYMTLGEELVDERGARHRMAGLLPVVTSFAQRKLHLGYRRVASLDAGPLGPKGARFKGHEFHYSTVEKEGPGESLFAVADARGRDLGNLGRRRGSVFGSYLHLIDAG